MTCTHAAMVRKKLIALNFKYDTLVMEESAQILEIETLIPMLLQQPTLSLQSTANTTASTMSDNASTNVHSALKRVVLIGDHFQLPPVVKHFVFQKFSKLDQSLFTRLIRLGVPHVQLDAQGRSRPEIASLYSWRYQQGMNQLTNLPNVSASADYTRANAGFKHTVQLINVDYFQEKGETTPTPYFYQNLGEAEYVVAVYQYMRLLRYPSAKITILCSYNGQVQLVKDVLAQRCKNNSVFQYPHAISTIDKYQGQQNDIILLSLVRTESVGYLRDIRRLIVGLSRAKLGLYIFYHENLFQHYKEFNTAVQSLKVKSNKLELVGNEGYPSTRLVDSVDKNLMHTINNVTEMGLLVYQMLQQSH